MKFNNKPTQTLLLCLLLFVTASVFSQNTLDKFTLKTIVIDAGHGGHDSGTMGKHRKEKDMALDYSLKLGQLINKEFPQIKVLYTRTTDKFISLKERAQFANRNQADLFISIHCNGGSKTATGTETFVLGLHRNEDNLKVAMRENNSILLEDDYNQHYGSFDPTSPEAYILFNMHQSVHLDQSLNIAKHIEENFKTQTKKKSRGVKQAGFLVLRETTMPSILVETGFLTNQKDETYMASNQGKAEIAHSIFLGVKAYKKALDIEAERILQKQFAQQRALKKQQETEQKRKAEIEEQKRRRQESSWAWPSLRVQNKSGDQYYIQLLVSKSYQKGKDVFHPFQNIIMSRIDVIDSYKYLLGPYKSKKEAMPAHKKAQQNGFRDAYILHFQNGKVVR